MTSSMQQSVWHVEVAPLTSLPMTRSQFLTYASDTDIPIGSLVSIPITSRTLSGVVFSSQKTSFAQAKKLPFKVKSILKVLQEGFLTPEQLQLAAFVSREYFTPLGRCLVHFTPNMAKSRVREFVHDKTITSESTTSKNIRLTSEQKYAIDTIANTHIPCYLFGPSSSGKTEVYIRAIKKKLSKSAGQALVLVPELTLIPQEIVRYGEAFGLENIAVIHSHLAPGAFYSAWGKIARGEVRVIIGTRQALFAPFRDLQLVVVDEEQDGAYKQWDMSPRYDGRRVALELASLYKAGIVFGSATPSLERYHKAMNGEYCLLRLSSLPMQPLSTIQTVNLRFERHQKNNSSISKELSHAIADTLKTKHQTILFINRQGASAFSVCHACATLLRCPSCKRALVFDMPSGLYTCLHCTHKSSTFPSCVACGGLVFKNIGIGTQKIEREIRKQFPFANVARIDRQSVQKKDAREIVFHDFAQGKIDILIGTQMATKGWDLPNVALIGMIDADSLFAFPDFRTDEHAFQHILQASGRMARMGSKTSGKALIQTFYPENPTIQKIQAKDYISFYTETIEQRELLFYPPFARLILVILQEKDSKKLMRDTKKIYKELLQHIASDTSQKIRLSEPYTPLLDTIRGQHRQYILLRFLATKNLPEHLITYLQKISQRCTIDIDPLTLS